ETVHWVPWTRKRRAEKDSTRRSGKVNFSRLSARSAPNVPSLRRLIERLGVRAEGFARVRIGVEHVPAAIEQELCARGFSHRRQMIEHVTARRVRRDHVGVAVHDEQTERGNEREQFP